MKSPMIQQATYIKTGERDKYSDLQVLSSAAGFYVGTLYVDDELGGMEMPGSRDSDYFATRIQAEEFLSRVERGLETTRMHP